MSSNTSEKVSKKWSYDSDIEDEDDEEWDVEQDSNTHSKNQIDPEHIYAKDIRGYDSNASENDDHELDDEYESDVDGFEVAHVDKDNDSAEDEIECWFSKQRSNRRKKQHKISNQNSKNLKNRKKRVQKLRSRQRFKSMRPLPMPDREEKVHILNDKITKSTDFTSTLGFSSVQGSDEGDDHSRSNSSSSRSSYKTASVKNERPPANADDAEDAEVHLCKITQCILWDCDFRFQLLPHQFVATLSVAGIDVPKLLNQLIDLKESHPENYHDLIKVDKEGKKNRKYFSLHNIHFLGTRGFLLADVMGLGKTISVSFEYLNMTLCIPFWL